jgi:site-specific DNA recombinase
MRVLGRIRLSRASEESTSPERQREIIEQWASANDHQIIGWAEDLDVSGSVDPFDTPALGPWLAEDRRTEWDVLCAWKLDRLARRAVPLHRLFGLCQDEGKLLVCVSDNIDLSHWVGRLIASVIAGVAEGELEAIRERTRGSQQKLRETGRWGGGIVFYGYLPVENPSAAGWVWEHDPHSSEVVLGIVEKVLHGQSTESIAVELNQRGELAPSDYSRKRVGKPTLGKKWSNNGIRTLLQNRSLLGQMSHKGVTVRDDAGDPIQKGPGLIDPDVFDLLQTALDSRSFKVSNRSINASPLLGVARCGMCERSMHLRQHHNKARQKTYRYYQCLGGGASGGGGHREHPTNIIKADELEELVQTTFIDRYGTLKVTERVYVRAESHTIALNEAVRAMEEIATLLATTSSDSGRKRLTAQYSALDSRVAELEQLPASESGWEWRERPQTYAEAWAEADAEARRQLLLKRGVVASVAVRGRVARQNPGALEFSIDAPDIEG